MNFKKLVGSAAAVGGVFLLSLFVFAEEGMMVVPKMKSAGMEPQYSVDLQGTYEDDKPTDSIPDADDFDEPEFFEEFNILYGDVDGDEKITTSDASAILRYIVGYTDNPDIGQPVKY